MKNLLKWPKLVEFSILIITFLKNTTSAIKISALQKSYNSDYYADNDDPNPNSALIMIDSQLNTEFSSHKFENWFGDPK